MGYNWYIDDCDEYEEDRDIDELIAEYLDNGNEERAFELIMSKHEYE